MSVATRVITASLALVTVITGCGGDGKAPTPPDEPGVPASLSIQAGGNQTAEPGASLPIAPVVLVRDAGGRALPGITVHFAVDSGGGNVSASSAVTNASGTVTPGTWQLGSSEGRHILSASVTGLTPLKVVATAQIIPVTLPEQTIPSSGGSVVISRPGSPIDGLRLEIPSGAYPGDQVVEVSYGTSAGFPHPAGSSVVTPTLTIRTSDASYANGVLSLTVPAAVPPNTFPVLVLRNAANGRSDVMMTTSYTPTSITAITGHFNGDKLMGADGSFAPQALAALGSPAADVTVTGIALPTALLDQPRNTGFRLVDMWEFPSLNTAIEDATDVGWAGTAGWYYTAHGGETNWLAFKFNEGLPVPFANPRGFRWVSVAQKNIYKPMRQAVLPKLIALHNASQGPDDPLNDFTRNSYNSIRSSFVLFPRSPQIALMISSSPLDFISWVLVTRSENGQLFMIDPNELERSFHPLTFEEAGMVPYVDFSGKVADMLVAPGLSLFADISQLVPQFARVQDGTIGQAEFPTYRAMMAWGDAPGESAPLTDPLYVFDDANPIRVWTECLTCVGLSRPSAIPPGTASVGVVAFYLMTTPYNQNLTGSGFGAKGTGKVGTASIAAPGEYTSGLVVNAHNPADNLPDSWDWLDWITFTNKRLAASILPSPVTGDVGADVVLTLDVTGGPEGLEYLWEFNDGETEVTTAPITSHKWTSPGDYTLKVTARVPATKQPVARASAPATIAAPLTLTPSSLNGAFDTDYVVTATYGGPPPQNASWIWELGDGRVMTTAVNSITVRYPPPNPLGERTYPFKVTLKDGNVTKGVATMDVIMGAPIYTAWKLIAKNVSVVNDTRARDENASTAWGNFLSDHEVGSPRYQAGWNAVWDAYVADSAFFFAGSTANAAVAMVVRDTLFGPPFPPQAGYFTGLYWWTYGSYPTSALTPISAGLKGSNGTLNRGGVSCAASYSAYFNPVGTLSSGRVRGQNWVATITSIAQENEPLVLHEYDVVFTGDKAVGTIWKRYRLSAGCEPGATFVTWEFKVDFTAERIK